MTSPDIQLGGDNVAGDVAPRLARIGGAAAILGIGVAAALGYVTGGEEGPTHFWFAYLVAFAFILTITMGAMFFTIIQHLVNAHWSVTVRRLAEVTMSVVPTVCLLGLPLLYPLLSEDITIWRWAEGHHEVGHGEAHGAEDAGHAEEGHGAEAAKEDHGDESEEAYAEHLEHGLHQRLVDHKLPYLNKNFFVGRLLGYFVLWFLLSRFFFRKSVEQDTADGIEPTLRMKKWSAPSVILFALTLSFASFDLLMSLDETWFSTIFGVYIFAGGYLSSIAWLVIVAKYLQSRGRMTEVIHKEHYHDLGKWMFAFTFFWGYIAFSQFMLIWYANIPEETHFYGFRITPAWHAWSWFLLIGHFIIPFGGLLSRHVKRSTNVLLGWAIYMMVMHWVDLYWIVMPNFQRGDVTASNPFGPVEVLLALGMFGFLVWAVARRAAGQSLVPLRDPLLGKSLGFKNI
ncbi:MAG: hypothetical protein ACPGQD_01735 [Planctomycetota bacterium]